MKFVVNSILALSTFCLGTTAFAGQASFHLPVEVHWGQATLPAGDYRLTLPEPSGTNNVFYLRGDGLSTFEMAGQSSRGETNGHSYLKLVQANGEYYVKEYVSGGMGKTFVFILPKKAHRMQFTERVLPVSGEGTK